MIRKLNLSQTLSEDLNHTHFTKAVNKVRRAEPDLYHYFAIAKKVVNECQTLGISEKPANEFVRGASCSCDC